MRKVPMTIGLLAGAAAATLIAFYSVEGLGKPSDEKTPAAGARPESVLSVPVRAVVKKTVPLFLDYVGTTEAIRSVTLQAKVTGYLARQAVPDGADVKQGDLLYVLDPRDYQAALEQSKAQGARDAAALDYARASQGRNAVLNKQGWVSHDTYDQVTSSMHQAEAAVAIDQALIQTAELNLRYTEIRAPFAGRLGRSQMHEGALITVAGTPFNTLVQLDPLYVTFNPGETDLDRIGKAAAAGSGTGQTLLLQHRGRVQSFHNDGAVGLGQPGCELMDTVRSDVAHPGVEPGDPAVGLEVTAGSFRSSGPLAVEAAQVRQLGVQRRRVGHPLQDRAVGVGHGCQHPDADIDADPGRGPVAPLLGPGDRHPHTGDDRRAGPADGDRKYPGPVFGDQALQAAGVLMGADRAEVRQAQMPPVGFEPHGAGRDRVAVPVPALLLETGEPDPLAGQLAGPGLLPTPVAVDRSFDPVRERFL